MASRESELQLFSGRWLVPVLALVQQQRGSRFVVLKLTLGISPDSLSRSLKQLMALGLVQRNPGYGHPLRPEYILTPAGQRVAVHCQRFEDAVQARNVAPVIYRKWSVPSLVAVNQGRKRFNDLKSALDITPRALTQALGRLSGAELISAAGDYRPTPAGSHLAALAESIYLAT